MEKISYLKNLLNIFPIQLFTDNYSYLIVSNSKGLLVDPALCDPVINFLKLNHPSITITHILVTHKHWDHAGEVEQLLTQLNNKVEVIAGEDEQLSYTTIPINKLTNLEFQGNQLQIIPVPCHTKGHVLYYLKAPDTKEQSLETDFQCKEALFTGDTLFVGGCGRFFEGNGQQMLQNFDIISKLPSQTKIYCGHEYTVSNLEWAIQVDNSNIQMKEKLNWAKERIQQKLMTIPSTIESEMQTNIFMKCRDIEIQKKLNLSDPSLIMDRLREMKNSNLTLI